MNQNTLAYIVINSIEPYCYEINNILCLPNEFRYRARYRSKWIPTISNLETLEGMDGVIVFRDWNTALLLPIRRIRITNITYVGDVIYIEYELLALIELDSDFSKSQEQINDFNKQMIVMLKDFANIPKNDLKNLVFINSDVTTNFIDKSFEGNNENIEFNNWGKIVSIIEKVECYKDIDFVKIISIHDENGKNVGLAKFNNLSGGYLIEGSNTYIISVFQQSYIPKERGDSSVASMRTINILSDNEYCEILKGSQVITGKYDLYDFKFRTKSISTSSNSDFILQITRKDNIEIPFIKIPIRIDRPTYKRIVQFVASVIFILGLFGLFFSDFLLPQFSNIVKNISIISMAISAYDFRDQMIIALKSLNIIRG
jgi:hypothetical protein